MANDKHKKAIGDRVRSLREALGMSQEQLAKRLGYSSRSTINKVELGINDIMQSKLPAYADALQTTVEYLLGVSDKADTPTPKRRGVKIPVLGRVAAGVPIEAIEEVLDYEEIEPELAATGDFFALQIQGDSMNPRMVNGDVVIVRQQSDIQSGEIAIVLVNGNDATCKKITKHENGGITLVSTNPAFAPVFYPADEVAALPVRIIGKVVELRAKF